VIELGMKVTYKLPPPQRPIFAERLWHGRVKAVLPEGVYIESTDPGYEGQREFVPYYCIVGNEESNTSHID
jgi:hypothetical protein